jgi:hypothetical protein
MPMNNVDLTSASPAGILSDAPDGKPAPAKLEAWGKAGVKGGEETYTFTQSIDAPKRKNTPLKNF